jgi:hypothetical protein
MYPLLNTPDNKKGNTMGLNRIVDVMLALVSVAAITAVVRAPNSASVIKEFGSAFSGSIRAATGA